MKLVEFVGLPAAGKTTIWRGLTDGHGMIGSRGYTIASIKERMSKSVHPAGLASVLDRVGVMWQPYRRWSQDRCYLQMSRSLLVRALEDKCELLLEVLDATARHSDAAKEFARTEFLRNLVDYEAARQHLEDEDVFWGEGGEGFCRGATFIYGRYKGNDREQRIRRYVSLCPLVDVVVFVKIDTELAFRRWKDRGTTVSHPIFAGATDETILKRFEGGLKILELGLDMFRERGTQVVEIDTTSCDVASAINDCAGKLRAIGLTA